MKLPHDFKMQDWQKTIFNKMTQILNNGGRLIIYPRPQGKPMKPLYYFLNEDHTYRPCTHTEWTEQLISIEKHVANDEINHCRISTIWLGLDHNYFEGPPLVFETMVFDIEKKSIYDNRYTTWQEAEEGHKKAVQWVKDGCKEDSE